MEFDKETPLSLIPRALSFLRASRAKTYARNRRAVTIDIPQRRHGSQRKKKKRYRDRWNEKRKIRQAYPRGNHHFTCIQDGSKTQHPSSPLSSHHRSATIFLKLFFIRLSRRCDTRIGRPPVLFSPQASFSRRFRPAVRNTSDTFDSR